jgi:hypothetical protein
VDNFNLLKMEQMVIGIIVGVIVFGLFRCFIKTKEINSENTLLK